MRKVDVAAVGMRTGLKTQNGQENSHEEANHATDP